MEMTAPPARSRVGYQLVHKDGTTRCRLQIPLGHPAARRRDNNGHVFEIEHAIEYAAGPGSQALRWINQRQRVGEEHQRARDGRTATDSRFPCRRGRSHRSPLLSAAG